MLLCLRLSAPPWLGGLMAFHRNGWRSSSQLPWELCRGRIFQWAWGRPAPSLLHGGCLSNCLSFSLRHSWTLPDGFEKPWPALQFVFVPQQP